jgi:UDP-glucose 4-epimerase
MSARPCCEISAGAERLKVLIFGGAGFVGLNIAASLLARGHGVTLFDRAGLPPAAEQILPDMAMR